MNPWHTSKVSSTEVDSKLQCSICLEDFKISEEIAKLICTHVFHESCISPWGNRQNTCPTCRVPFKSDTISASDDSSTDEEEWALEELTDEEEVDDDVSLVSSNGMGSADISEDLFLTPTTELIDQAAVALGISIDCDTLTDTYSDGYDVSDIFSDGSMDWDDEDQSGEYLDIDVIDDVDEEVISENDFYG